MVPPSSLLHSEGSLGTGDASGADPDAIGPRVRLIDVRGSGVDQQGLRDAAWGLTETLTSGGARHVSRSYRWPLALVAGWALAVGVDIERVETEADRAFADSICTPEERIELGARRFDPAVVASLWCGKEAVAKALGDALAYDPRRLGAPLLWPDGVSGRWHARPLEVSPGYVGWVCWLAAAANPQVEG
jgi:hypothetical protein